MTYDFHVYCMVYCTIDSIPPFPQITWRELPQQSIINFLSTMLATDMRHLTDEQQNGTTENTDGSKLIIKPTGL